MSSIWFASCLLCSFVLEWDMVFYFLKGLPACGKSAWAKQKIAEFRHKGVVRVNNDDLRMALHDGKWSPTNEKFIGVVRDAIIQAAFVDKQVVILDNTNLNPVHEKHYREMATQEGYTFEVVDFVTGPLAVSLEECLKRDQKRANYVGEKVIKDMYKRYIKPPDPRPEIDPNLPWAVICDLDGTLALFNGRGPFDEAKVYDDLVNKPVHAAVAALVGDNSPLKLIFCSGRTDGCRETTLRWLQEKAGFTVDDDKAFLFMRASGDKRHDNIVKREIYDQHIRGKFNIQCIFDDRRQVIEMWRSLGLPTFQVADGEF